MEFFWIRSVVSNKFVEDMTNSKHLIILDVFTIDDVSHKVILARPRLILSKVPVSTRQALEGLIRESDPAPESELTSTTCGFTMTQLLSAASFTCGTYITFLIPSESEPNQVKIFFFVILEKKLFLPLIFGKSKNILELIRKFGNEN